MVGLKEFGEAAWACEQLYNTQLADQPRRPSPTLLDFTDGRARLPGRLGRRHRARTAMAAPHARRPSRRAAPAACAAGTAGRCRWRRAPAAAVGGRCRCRPSARACRRTCRRPTALELPAGDVAARRRVAPRWPSSSTCPRSTAWPPQRRPSADQPPRPRLRPAGADEPFDPHGRRQPLPLSAMPAAARRLVDLAFELIDARPGRRCCRPAAGRADRAERRPAVRGRRPTVPLEHRREPTPEPPTTRTSRSSARCASASRCSTSISTRPTSCRAA